MINGLTYPAESKDVIIDCRWLESSYAPFGPVGSPNLSIKSGIIRHPYGLIVSKVE